MLRLMTGLWQSAASKVPQYTKGFSVSPREAQYINAYFAHAGNLHIVVESTFRAIMLHAP